VPRRFVPALGVATLVLALVPAATAAASTTVECGQIMAYTAPDPVAPTDGSLTIGLLPTWAIDSDATLSPAIQANLASLPGSSPSCLALETDGSDVITGLDFVASGTISGDVVYEASIPGEVFADRLLVPTFITDAYPGLAAVFVTSEAAGTEVTATFQVDTSTGQLTGVMAHAGFCGPADLAGDGDGIVGAATIPAAVLDSTATAKLVKANGDSACAAVDIDGTIGGGGLDLETEVVITLAASATPPDTAAIVPGAAAVVDGRWAWLAAVALAGFAVALRLARPSARSDRERPGRRA
jgi:hypothetical protein